MSAATTRRTRIAEEVERRGTVSVAELGHLYHVSEMTVRRDLRELEDQGVLRRYRGGALVDRRRSYEPPYALRETQRKEEKQRIGAAAAGLISDDGSVAVDYGTTAIEVARCLSTKVELSVVTPNVRAALELVEAPGVRVILSGGALRPGELTLVGREAERTFERHFVDAAIIGTAAIDADRGVTDYNTEEVSVKQAMIASADRVIVVADASKVGVVAFSAVAPIESVHALVTTVPASDPRLERIADHGVEIHFV